MTFSQNEQKHSLKIFGMFIFGIFLGAFFVFLLLKTEFFTKETALQSDNSKN